MNSSAISVSAVQPEETPLGIDVRKVAETGILPRLNTGIAHKEPGIGMVGVGGAVCAGAVLRRGVRGGAGVVSGRTVDWRDLRINL